MAKIVEDLTKLYGSFDWDDHEVRQRPKKSLSRKDKNKARQKRLMAATRMDGFGSYYPIHGSKSNESCCSIS